MVYEETTSDLVKYNPQLVETARIKGVKPLNIKGSEMVSTLYSGDDFMYIWMPGDSSIGLVQPETMVHDLVTNFYGTQEEKVKPFTVVANHIDKKVLGMYVK